MQICELPFHEGVYHLLNSVQYSADGFHDRMVGLSTLFQGHFPVTIIHPMIPPMGTNHPLYIDAGLGKGISETVLKLPDQSDSVSHFCTLPLPALYAVKTTTQLPNC